MARAISYVPKRVEPKLELQRRLEAAPNEHAEALLVAYDLLEEAHQQGVLDALQGAIHARETIFRLLSDSLAEPASVNAIRNLLVAGKLIGTLNPESFSNLEKRINEKKVSDSPSLWSIFKTIRRPDTRRGLAMALAVIAALGRATETPPHEEPS